MTVFIIWGGEGLFAPWVIIIAQARQPNWDSAILKITVPFMVVNYVAVFASFYMLFGTVIDPAGVAIEGVWKHFYFSAVTLTTLGYGNLTPQGITSEIIATTEAIVGFIGIALLVGVLVYIAAVRAELDEKA
jgi:hypothetical protein